MENQGKTKPVEQVNVQLQGQDAEDFRAYIGTEVLPTKAAAGTKLIIEGLRRWKAEQAALSAERIGA
ncbi:MAG: hypothetical protein L0229_20380 [Blastocatellia bacterium]|nr:hypothetical protein [Blastocatellia bacterium]